MSCFKKLLFALTLSAFSLPSFSDAYIGTGAALSTIDTDDSLEDDEDAVLSFFWGLQVHKMVSLEVGYYNLGRYTIEGGPSALDTNLDITALSVNGNFIFPLRVVDIYAKAGVYDESLEMRTSDGANVANDNDGFFNNIVYGVGVSKNFGAFDFFAEYLIFDNDEDIDLSTLGLGVRFLFQ